MVNHMSGDYKSLPVRAAVKSLFQFSAAFWQLIRPWDQVADIVFRIVIKMQKHLFQNILEVFIWLQVIRLCCLCDAVQHRTRFGSTFRINDLPVLFANAERSDTAFCIVIIQRDYRIRQEEPQIRFLIDRIINGFCRLRRLVKLRAALQGFQP